MLSTQVDVITQHRNGGILLRQSDWSLSCDHGLGYGDELMRTTAATTTAPATTSFTTATTTPPPTITIPSPTKPLPKPKIQDQQQQQQNGHGPTFEAAPGHAVA